MYLFSRNFYRFFGDTISNSKNKVFFVHSNTSILLDFQKLDEYALIFFLNNKYIQCTLTSVLQTPTVIK